MNPILSAVCVVFVFMGGYALGSIHNYVDTMMHCTSYRQGDIIWIGYRAINNDNERRCFWLQDGFPYRVRQGVEVKR